MLLRIAYAAAVGLSLLSVPAFGQVTTDCQNYLPGYTRCTTTTPPAPLERRPTVDWSGFAKIQAEQAAQAQANGRALGEALARARDQKAAEAADQKRAAIVQSLAPLIASHECDKAVSVAMSAGDLDLAERVKRLCVPTQ